MLRTFFKLAITGGFLYALRTSAKLDNLPWNPDDPIGFNLIPYMVVFFGFVKGHLVVETLAPVLKAKTPIPKGHSEVSVGVLVRSEASGIKINGIRQSKAIVEFAGQTLRFDALDPRLQRLQAGAEVVLRHPPDAFGKARVDEAATLERQASNPMLW